MSPKPFPLTPVSLIASRRASHAVPVFPASIDALGVGHPANRAASVNVVPECRPLSVEYPAAALDAESPRVGVGHPHGTEEDPLSNVRRPDARSAQIRSPDGVARCFQVSPYNVEPRKASPARNLLSKDDWRAALADETKPLGPEVAIVSGAASLAGDGEGLAGAAPGPDGPVVGPPDESEGVGPSAEAGEGVELGSAHKVSCAKLTNGTSIDGSRGDVPGVGEVAEPRRGVGLDLVVKRAHRAPHNARTLAR